MGITKVPDRFIRTESRLIVLPDKEFVRLMIVNVDPLLKSIATRVAIDLFGLTVHQSDKDLVIERFDQNLLNRFISFTRHSILELKDGKELSINKIEIIHRLVV